MPTVLKDSRQRYLPFGQAIYTFGVRYVPSARDMFALRTRANIISHRAKRDISQLRSSYIAFCIFAKHIAFGICSTNSLLAPICDKKPTEIRFISLLQPVFHLLSFRIRLGADDLFLYHILKLYEFFRGKRKID